MKWSKLCGKCCTDLRNWQVGTGRGKIIPWICASAYRASESSCSCKQSQFRRPFPSVQLPDARILIHTPSCACNSHGTETCKPEDGMSDPRTEVSAG